MVSPGALLTSQLLDFQDGCFLPSPRRVSGLAGQTVALLLYLRYELVVGVDELLHALLFHYLDYVIVVHASFLKLLEEPAGVLHPLFQRSSDLGMVYRRGQGLLWHGVDCIGADEVLDVHHSL